jgi:hypothetical protein
MTPTALIVQNILTEGLPLRKDTYNISPPHVSPPHVSPRHRSALEKTEYTVDQATDTSLLQIPVDQQNESIVTYNEKILEWWMGTVTDICEEERYFVAHLEDNEGIGSIAEFDIDGSIEHSVYKGSRFIFSVFSRSQEGSMDTTSRIEFIPPQIWTEEDDKEVKEIYK